MATKYDYQLLEREYVTTDLSIRALCEKHGITSWSTVNVQAKKREWEKKRADYKRAQFEHDIAALAQRRAQKLAEVADDFVDGVRALLYKMYENLKSPDYVVTPQDFNKIFATFQLMTGGVTNREEHLNLNADLPLELLRELQNAARANGAGPRAVEQSPLPLAEGARKIN